MLLKGNSKLPLMIQEQQEICVDYEPTDTFTNWSINEKLQSEWTDVDWLAKMMMSEIHDSTMIESIYLIGITAKNHTKLLNKSLVEVLTKPKSFSGVNHPTYHWWKAEPTAVHKLLAIKILSENSPKHLTELFAFCVFDQVGISAKNWFSKFKVYKKINTVSFYINEKV
jgi:hypothetical protein